MKQSRKNTLLISLFLLFFSFSGNEGYASEIQFLKNKGGIFSVRNISASNRLEDVSELNLPYVAGLSVRFRWEDIEPKPGEFDWSLLEKAHELTVASNKLLMIRVIAGTFSPGWIYGQGVQKITFYGDETNWMKPDAVATMPIPWDENYLQAWERFLKSFGNKILDWSNVYCVQMTGGGVIGEMFLPKKRESTIEEWAKAGISDEKLFYVWKRIIESYDKCIPKGVGLGLDLGVPFKGSRTSELINEYALENYAVRVWFQYNGLKEVYLPTDRWSEMIRESSKKTIVGYQMVGGGQFLDTQTGDRKIAFEHAIEDGCSYVEVYVADLRDPKWKEAMVFLANGLAKNYTNGPTIYSVSPTASP